MKVVLSLFSFMAILFSSSIWASAFSEKELGNFNKLPVSELHVHADGGILSASLIDYLAQKNHIPVSSRDYIRDGVIYNKPGDFLDFLAVYDRVTELIKTKDDLTYVMYDYLRRCHEDGAIYVELSTSPMHFQKIAQSFGVSNKIESRQGMDYPIVINAITAAIDKAHHDFGIDARILVVILRHNGPEEGEKLLDQMLAYPHPYVVGISLAGDDIHFPARQFNNIYEKAKRAGLKLSAHMGEHTGPNDIQIAIDMKLDRIGHGLSVIKNKKIMAEVKKTNIGFEVCPSSNINGGNGIYKSFATHPLKKMIENNLFISLSTDDPAFLHTSIGKEYKLVQQSYHLSDKKMIQICRDAIRMSFANDILKSKLLLHIALYENATIIKNITRSSTKNKKIISLLDRYMKQPTLHHAIILKENIKLSKIDNKPVILKKINRLISEHEQYKKTGIKS